MTCPPLFTRSPFLLPPRGPRCLGILALLAALVCTARCSSEDRDVAVLRMADGGVIRLRFHTAEAPGTVANFKKLAREHFYDGTRFHRVIPGFMIQGGDPNSKDDDPGNDGFGGPGYTIPDEFSKIRHERGTVSMARPDTPNSAGSQFFIMLSARGANGEDWPASLDGKYTAFAWVIDGMDVVDRIAALPRIEGFVPFEERPQDPPVVESIVIETGDGKPASTAPAAKPLAPARAPAEEQKSAPSGSRGVPAQSGSESAPAPGPGGSSPTSSPR